MDFPCLNVRLTLIVSWHIRSSQTVLQNDIALMLLGVLGLESNSDMGKIQ